MPWCCTGDFNEITRMSEKSGHRGHNDRQMQEFRKVIDECEFLDLGYRGLPFTCCNNRKGDATTWLRLDRFMATNEWLLQFPSAVVYHLDSTEFEDMWHTERGCEETVIKAWVPKARSPPMFQVQDMIYCCGRDLTKWSHAHFGSVKKQIKEKQEELKLAEEKSTRGQGVKQVLEGIHQSVTAEINSQLLRPYTEMEVSVALKQMAPLKAPGPDEMPPIFYQSYWKFIGNDVVQAVLSSINSGTLLPSINHTFVTLIPKRTGKHGSMALKLDISKAYDRVEWEFLRQVMIKMGFHSQWVSLIMECITTVSYSLLINGEPTGHITLSRGLRQGDPISPYLFLICAEGLNGLLNKEASNGEIHGISICRRSPKLTHLFFADDNLLFCRATQTECQKIQEILQVYEKASGQQLNRSKTTLFFSRNTTQATQEAIKSILGVPSIRQYEKYLGLPSLVGKEKMQCFSKIKERVWSKVKGWKEKLLSQAGREILIKVVWGQKEQERKIHWIKWKKLCQTKEMGGLGFRELQKFNIALLAKQFWRLMNCKDSLLFKVFSPKFFPTGNILEASEKTRGSFAWRSIMQAKDLILAGSSWKVGNGQKIPIRNSNRLPEEGHRRIISPLSNIPPDSRVAKLIMGAPPEMDCEKIQAAFLPYDADAILQIPLSSRSPPDKLIWHATKNGKYSVRSGYHLLL
uniref:Reverse transcriptase domain-containing protein n=1 Tax=Fagus sylvatica TaxID=28930 RepID=A0A2N9HZ73_FAGSY